MLPTSGYFRGINCPGHEKGHCSRPFCHFHHSSKKEASSGVPNASSSVEQDKVDDQTRAKSTPLVKPQSTEGSPSCSKSEATTNPVTPDVDNQSDLLQQLVSEAVKKVLIENPHLASAGVNPSTLITQTTAEVSPVNIGSKKKYYPRPPDTPSYNPTPIRELNKRKRSSEGQDDLPSNSKAAKYVPAALDFQNIISDATKNKESGDSDATDFSSPEDEDLDQQNCDFDILEEVLAEHSQNKKIKVKKKKVKALGKLQYNLTNNDKKVDESSMISDAQLMSDQDSNTCDDPKKDSKNEEEQPEAGSYFLPPSPIFTSSSDGFAAYNSIAYAKSETVEDKDKGENADDQALAEPLQDCDKNKVEEDSRESIRSAIQSKEVNCVKKSVSKGHSMLPKFVHALGAPRLLRPNVRSWNPQGRSSSTSAESNKDSNGDPLEAMLQQMDGDQAVAKGLEKGDASDPIKDRTKTTVSSPKNSKKYKVDLDKEIKSLATSPSLTNDNKEKITDKETGVIETGCNEKGQELAKKTVDADEKARTNENEDSESHDKLSSKNVAPRERQEKHRKSSKLEPDKKKSNDSAISSKGSHSEEESEGGDSVDREGKSSDESEGEQDSRKKRKRDHSSGSDSHESYHRKKKKKSHKRRKKYKKRRRRRDSRSESGDSDVDSAKDDDDEEEENKEKAGKEEEEKLDSSETNDKEESERVKKHKKRKKKRHRKKSKHRKRSKNKIRKKNRSRSASLSSSQERSRSTSLRRSSSRHRSRSSSRHGSRDRHKSRSDSEHRSRSNSRHRNRKNSRYQSSSRSRSRSSSRHRSRRRSRSRSNSRHKSRSRSNSRHKSRSRSNSRHSSRSRSRSKSRHRTRSSTNYRSRSSSRHVSRSPSKDRCSSQNKATGRDTKNLEAKHKRDKSKSISTHSSAVSTKNDKDRGSAISIPMPIDPSKIKVEKDAVSSSASVIVPDLSIVKKEKEEEPSLPCTATVKIEKTKESPNEKQHCTSDASDQPERTSKQSDLSSSTSISLGKHLNSQDSAKRSSDEALNRRDSSSHHRKSSKEANLQDSHQKKEYNKTSEVKERRKSNAERRSSSESTSNQKSNCHSSTEKEHSYPKAPASARRASTSEKLKENSVSSSLKGLSMFDMVEASIQPSKPKVLKEISIFDKVSAVGYESSSDSAIPSDLDAPDVSENKSPDQSSANQRKKLSQSLSVEKSSSDVKTHKDRSHSKSGKEKDSQDRSSSSSQSKSKTHREHKSIASHSSSSSSKHSHSSHSSSSKHRSSSQQSSSHIHKSSSSLPKSSSNLSRGVANENDAVGSSSSSSKSSHVSNSVSSKSKAKSSSSSSSKQEVCHSTSKHSGHHRKHSTSSADREKDLGKATHKSRDQRKNSGSKEKECSSSSHHGSRGKGSTKDSTDDRKDHKSGSHSSRHKEEGKSRSDKVKEVVCNDKKSSSKEVDESSSGSDRDLYGGNDDDNDCADDDDDGDMGNNSPFPDLSALDEIPQDDWEQLINSSEDDLKHLEDLRSDDFDLDDLDKDDPGIMEECLQMYNDYKPDPDEIENQVSKRKAKVDPKEELEPLPSKHRVARTTVSGNLLGSKSNAESRARKKTPAQVMMERYQKLKEQQAELLKQLEKQKQQLEEQGRGVAAGASSSSSHAVSSTTSPRSKPGVVSSSSVSSTTPSRSKIAPASSTSLKSSPHSTSGAPKRRMSHVPNVTSLLQAKEKIKNLPPQKSRSLLSPNVASASGVIPQTIAHTVAKGGKRLAHTPKVETLRRPTITPEFGSKVPPNIRQRYLNSLIDECLKFLGQREAFSLGLAEEKVCFQRASSRMVYLNLAVNAVKRLRNQQEAGEAAQELLETDPMFKDATYTEDQPAAEKPSTSRVSSTQSSEAKPHPINPNHSRLSHFSVLAVGGQRGSWSIEKPKKNTANVQNCLKGMNFYNMLKKYILNEQQLADNGYPCPDPDEKGKAIVKVVDHRKKLSPSSVERYCDRCSVLYTVDKWGFPLSDGPCVHHWGRSYKQRGYSGWETRYSCCGGDSSSDGCCQATTHVSHNYDPNKLRGYVRTLPKDVKNNDYGVFALDCEMCYTTGGCELTRVTVIDSECKTVYEQLVKPENPIIDYNTRFSGITESDMEDVKTNIRDVQASLLTKFSDKSILIGHSLESDFHALKLIHDTVVDTSVVFPHKMGPPYKRALKNLASEYLKKIIQNDVSGHDSAEDAIACMHLMQWRVKEDLKGFGTK